MKLLLKISGIILVLGLVGALEFLLFGERFEQFFSQDACVRWFAAGRSHAWLIGIALLASDLLLPIPASGVMAAMGAVYGFWSGTLLSALGSFAAGCLGYYLALLFGGRAIRRITSAEELAKFQHLFQQWGGMAIIASRLLPILPETLTIAAGLAGMGQNRFLLSLALGCLPPAVLFSLTGATLAATPLTGMVVATLIPALLWPLAQRLLPPPAAGKSCTDSDHGCTVIGQHGDGSRRDAGDHER